MRVRALTFRKRFAQLNHDRSWWATLGHTDEMVCSDLENMSLEEINAFNEHQYKQDSVNAYHHVVYLIDSEETEDCYVDQALWNKQDAFLSVTRIHFPKTEDLDNQCKAVKQHIDSFSNKNEYSNSQIIWKTYYTMELSDIVLISKSTSFQLLSQWSLSVTNTPLVGKAYTNFCIPSMLLETPTQNWPATLDNDTITFLAIRFSIQKGEVDDALKTYRSCLGDEYTLKPFRVAGNEDVIICGQDVPTKNLMKLYQSWYQSESDVLVLFRDIITRVGTSWEKPSSDRTNNSSLISYSEALLKKVQENVLLKPSLPLKDKAWMRPLVELTNALVHMSHSATLDEPVLLILPALTAFWENVIKNPDDLCNEPMYLRFAELCVHTLEHLMRAEGQLSQRPEMRPLVYDIPVFVLEYAHAFLSLLREEFTKPDGQEVAHIRFLLAPSAETMVSTDELFDPCPKESVSGLLQITVPFSFLYKPKQLLPTLCHELAHYVGEQLRMRKLRYNLFLWAAAEEMIKTFFDVLDEDAKGLREFVCEVILQETIGEKYGEEVYSWPLLEIVNAIEAIVKEIAEIYEDSPHGYDAYLELLRNYLKSNYTKVRLYSLPQNILLRRYFAFKDRLYDLTILFRETYADVLTLYCLEILPQEYLNIAITNIEELCVSALLTRIYVSLTAAGYSSERIKSELISWTNEKQISADIKNQIQDDLQKIIDLIRNEETSSEKYLLLYLQKCWNGFRILLPKESGQSSKHTSKRIYEQLANINKETKYQDILSVIDHGRQNTLAQIKSSLGLVQASSDPGGFGEEDQSDGHGHDQTNRFQN